MRRFALTQLAVSVGMLFASTAQATLVVTEVAPQTVSGTVTAINGDWWELTNFGSVGVNLLGYQWADTEDALPSTDSNFFPSFVINAGESVIILDEAAASEAAWRTNWGIASSVRILAIDEMVDDSMPEGDTFSGLGSSNDAVFFYAPDGVLLSSYAYTSTVRGTSFEQSGAGLDLGLSVIGENGAFKALNNNIGSPGVAVAPVPVPGLGIGFGVAATAMLSLMRRRRAAI
mgnify:CR=1 FL=1